jgi:HEAT repeat protein
MKNVSFLSITFCLVAASSLWAEVPRKQDVPRYIMQLLSDNSAKVRAAAAEALGHRGAVKKADVLQAIDPLLKALKNDRDATVRKAAADALASINPDDKVAIKPLIEALQDQSIDVQMAAATALGSFGRDAEEAVEPLQKVKQEAEKDSKGKKGKKTPAERKKQQLARAAAMALRSIAGQPRKK